MIVADTNIIAYLLMNGPYTELAERLVLADPHWVAPLLWQSEFQNMLATQLRAKRFPLSEALLLMKKANLQMKDKALPVSSDQVLALAESSSCTAYDCEFVALAMDLDVPLITTDKQLLSAFPQVARSLLDFNH